MTHCASIRRSLSLGVVMLLGAAVVASTAVAQCYRPNDCLPPQGGCVYASSNIVCYPGTTVCFKDLELDNPTACQSASQGTFDSFFDITYRIQRSTDGGATWTPLTGTTPGHMHFSPNSSGTGLDGDFSAMDIFGPVHIRECPTRPSTGGTTVKTTADPTYQIDSFFDVFTELSLDGGNTWIDAVDPYHVQLGGAPTSTQATTWGHVKALYR